MQNVPRESRANCRASTQYGSRATPDRVPRREQCLSDEQRRVAEETIADVDASDLWPGPVVTEVAEAGPFWEAEPEHQDYLLRNPGGYTCHFPRPDWRLPRRAGTRTA